MKHGCFLIIFSPLHPKSYVLVCGIHTMGYGPNPCLSFCPPSPSIHATYVPEIIIIIIIIHGIVTQLLGLTGGESPQQVTHLPPVWDLLLALA